MTTSKGLAWGQMGMIFASFIITIFISVHLANKGFTFKDANGLLYGNLGISVASLVTGIMQLVFSTKNNDNTQRGMIAGVLGLLIFIPFVEILGFIANIFVITEKQ